MFKFFSKAQNKDKFIMAPVNGKCIPLSQVTDQVFSQKMMGDGVAFIFEGDTIYAPCSGKVATIAKSKHAIAIQSEEGIEVLIHVGMNTVSLKGQGFEVMVDVDQKVKMGAPLLKIDRALMQEHNIDMTTPMIIANTPDYHLELLNVDRVVEGAHSQVIKYEQKLK